jgi:hypothetical protein
MNNARLKMGLSGLSVPAFLVKCRKVVTNLTDNNVLFPNPAPPLALVTTTIDELDDLQERMGTEGGTNNTILRNLAQEQVMVQMRLLATYVSNVAQGNADIILKSGFGIHDSAEKTEEKLPPPTEVVVTCDGLNFGELMVRWAGVPGNTGYTISIAEMVNGQAQVWHNEKPVKRKHHYKGLVSGTQYGIRLATLNSQGIGTWSQAIVYRPQ